MKEKLKKAIIIFLTIGEIFVLSFSTNAKTNSPKITFKDAYLTFEIWKGSGTSSVKIGDDVLTKNRNIVKFDEFEELQYDGKVFDGSDYSVTELGSNTIITLKEEYLKTLKDGAYSFDAVFSRAIIPIKLHVVTHKVSLTDAYFTFNLWAGSGSAQVALIPDTFSYTFYPELFEELQYKGKKVDDSNYSISQFMNVTKIILEEKYVKALSNGEHYFIAEFMNVRVKLKLKKETVKVKKPVKVKEVKVASKKKKLKLKWSKQKNVTGYQIKIGTNKKITKNTKIVTIKKNKNGVIVKGLKANKKYYLKVRAYKKINGKKYWGSWSTRISKKTK